MIDGASAPKAVRLIISAAGAFRRDCGLDLHVVHRCVERASCSRAGRTDNLKTLPVGVQDLYKSTITDWGMVMAAGVMITIPALLFFLAVQRYLIARLGTGRRQGIDRALGCLEPLASTHDKASSRRAFPCGRPCARLRGAGFPATICAARGNPEHRASHPVARLAARGPAGT